MFDPNLYVLFTCSVFPHEAMVPSFFITSPSNVIISLKPGTFLFRISNAVFKSSQITFPLQNYCRKYSIPSKFLSKSMMSIEEIPDFPTFYLMELLSKLAFLTLLKMIKVLIVFISLSFSEMLFEDFSSLQSRCLLIPAVNILNATMYLWLVGLIFC